ncbi:hypothetical protein OMW55_10010 [Sphingomonas sp. BN140010]|uniref:Uncharacterized protein n=1 Tax=Sphingomonas arvum TaxID=2992113 RepID=A0ABT3JGD1_9SPHN|nr:hypothetical protein [Sphingomonas sp. BN140010]MCW3798137.1 hypothetical protein [Sphingomonas sp. BN140010]
MKQPTLVLALLLTAACNRNDRIAQNAATPPLNVTSETPGDWSELRLLTGRTPADSGLFQDSPITVDLNALLGAEATTYRRAIEGGSMLAPVGPVLITVAADRSAYLVIFPDDHALEAGLKTPRGWRRWNTPGSNVPRPAAIAQLLAS